MHCFSKTNLSKFIFLVVFLVRAHTLLAIGFDIRSEMNKVAKDGYSGSVKFTTENKWGNTLSSAYWVQAVARYRSGKHTGIAVLKIENEQTDTEPYTGNSLGQLLYRYNVNKLFDMETSLTDYRDEFRGFSKRISGAVGPRFRIIVDDKTEFYLGLAVMYESQNLLSEHRYPGQPSFENGTWILLSESYSREIKDVMSFTTSFLLQISAEDITDVRFVPTIGIKVPFNKYFSYFIQANYIYESEPPYDVIKYDLTLRQGLYLNFEIE